MAVIGTLVRFFWIAVGLVIAWLILNWFIDHAGEAGRFVGDLITSIETFFTSLFNASPLGR